MKFGTVPFVNMAPYYRFLSRTWLNEHELVDAGPRALGEAARRGAVDAAPFSFADGRALVASGDFEWLGALGVAGFGPIRSILLVGADRLEACAGRAVAVSPHTATTVRLLEVLLRETHGVRDYRLVPPDPAAPLRLLIGDEALSVHRRAPDLPVVDLSDAWTRWTGLPFVFARWAVRRSLPTRDKGRLGATVGSGLDLSLGDLEAVAETESDRTGLPADELLSYLRGIRYHLGPAELAGAERFAAELDRLPA